MNTAVNTTRKFNAMTNSVKLATEGVNNSKGAVQQVVQGANNLSNNRVVAANANSRNATNKYKKAGNNFRNAANALTPYINTKTANLNKARRALNNASKAAALAQGAKAIALAVQAVEEIGKEGNKTFPNLTRSNTNFGPRTPNRS